MSSTPIGTRFTSKWASAALVIGSTVAVLASPLAVGAASASTPITSVTITSGAGANANAGALSTTPVFVSYTPTSGTASIDYTVISGPDTPATNLAGTACTPLAAGTARCDIANVGNPPAVAAGTPGVDQVVIFADNDASSTFNGGDQSASTSVTFSGVPNTVSLVPNRNQSTHTLTTEDNTCEVYKVSAFDAGSRPSGARSILVQAIENEPVADAANPFEIVTVNSATGLCNNTNVGMALAACTTVPPCLTVPAAGTHNLRMGYTATTGNDGSVLIGLLSNQAGTGELLAVSADTPSATDADNITFGAGGPDSVATLTVTPNSYTGYTGTAATYTVHAADAGGNPVEGASLPAGFTPAALQFSVNEQENSGPGTTAPTACSVGTDQNGNATCTITNGGTAGPQSETFWVNHTAATCSPTTPGPDACDPQTTANATFNVIPTFSASSLTCVQALNNAQQGQAVTNCTVPTTQHSIVFSEKLTNGASNVPVPGVIVDFSAIGTLGGVGATPSGEATTDANGVATFTVNDPSAQNGDGVTVSAKVGVTTINGPTFGSWASPAATTLAVTPPVTSVTKGGAVSEKVQVTDQFGNGVSATNSLTYVVAGRNNGHTAIVSTDSTGAATIAYTDASINAASAMDTISVTDTTTPLTGSATIDYINGTTTATAITVDASGTGTSDGSCSASAAGATNVAFTHQTEVCAIVKNAAGEVLAGQPVVFTVGNGQVAAHGTLSATSSTTYTATTDGNGVAFADVTSTKTGAQSVTATDSVSGSSSVTYAAPAASQARNVTVSPTTQSVTAGTSQKFTFTVTDQYGNDVQGVNVAITQSGSGILSSGSTSATAATDQNGQASVLLNTQATDTGAGSVTGNITGGNVCGNAAGVPAGTTAGNCTAAATYTIAAPITPHTLTLVAAPGGKVGAVELVAATVKNSDGSPAANQVVRYTISGANSASGAVATNSNGVALFGYKPTHSGTDTVRAYDDVNDDQLQEATEPTDSLAVPINKVTEKPTNKLTTTKGVVTIHVTSHPAIAGATVTYYVKHLGKFTKIGTSKTGHAGRASKSFVETRGVTYTFRTKITGKGGVKTGTSSSKSIKVKK